ncbi:hypothetical protein ACKUZO_020370 [Acinetobacter baumannii]
MAKAGKAAEKFQEVVESLKGLQPPNIKPIKTNIFIDGRFRGSAKDFLLPIQERNLKINKATFGWFFCEKKLMSENILTSKC